MSRVLRIDQRATMEGELAHDLVLKLIEQVDDGALALFSQLVLLGQDRVDKQLVRTEARLRLTAWHCRQGHGIGLAIGII